MRGRWHGYLIAVLFVSLSSLAFRSSSGSAGGPGENELTTFFELASSNSAALLVSFLTLWGEQ